MKTGYARALIQLSENNLFEYVQGRERDLRDSLETLSERLDELENENEELRDRVYFLEATRGAEEVETEPAE